MKWTLLKMISVSYHRTGMKEYFFKLQKMRLQDWFISCETVFQVES